MVCGLQYFLVIFIFIINYNYFKFQKEMSEKHNVSEIMALARDLVDRLRYIISDQK